MNITHRALVLRHAASIHRAFTSDDILTAIQADRMDRRLTLPRHTPSRWQIGKILRNSGEYQRLPRDRETFQKHGWIRIRSDGGKGL